MRSPTLCLAAFVAVLFVVSSNAMPCDQGASYIKADKSSSSTNCASSSSTSDEEVIQANGCGQFSKEKSSSSNQAACSSASKNQASYEAGNSKDGSFVKKDSSSESANSAAAASCNSHEKIVADSGSGQYIKENSQSATQAAAASSAKSSDSYEASNCGGKGSYVKAKKSSDTKAAASSSSSKSDSYEAYNGGGGSIVIGGGSGGSGSGGSGSGSTKSCGCTTKSITIEEIKKKYDRKSGESDECYFKRLVCIDAKSDQDYTETFMKIYNLYHNQPVWNDKKYMNTVKDCYTKVYTKKPCESEDSYFKRITDRYPCESDTEYYNRLRILSYLLPKLKLWCDDKYSCYTKNMYLWWYKKTCSDTSDDVYFKRILDKYDGETDDCYVKRIDMIRRCYPNLAVWCDTRYISITKTYYTKAYTKRDGESEEVYYSRIVTKESGESTECWVQRVYIIHQCIPTISLWWNKNYYKYTKTYYDNFCKKLSIDTCDKDMYTRITRQFSGESDTMYESRMTIFEENYYTLTCWSDITYLELVKHYYIIRYSKKSCESDDVWVKRIFADSKCDTSAVIRYRRINIIHRLIPTCPCWYETKYYESYTKPYYSCFYKKDDKVSCVEWLTETLKVYDGETEEMACKRIALIKKCTCNCGCWTSDNFSKVKCCKGISSSYYELIKKTYFSCSDVQYEKKSSSTSSSSSSASSCAEDSEVVIKRGVC